MFHSTCTTQTWPKEVEPFVPPFKEDIKQQLNMQSVKHQRVVLCVENDSAKGALAVQDFSAPQHHWRSHSGVVLLKEPLLEIAQASTCQPNRWLTLRGSVITFLSHCSLNAPRWRVFKLIKSCHLFNCPERICICIANLRTQIWRIASGMQPLSSPASISVRSFHSALVSALGSTFSRHFCVQLGIRYNFRLIFYYLFIF